MYYQHNKWGHESPCDGPVEVWFVSRHLFDTSGKLSGTENPANSDGLKEAAPKDCDSTSTIKVHQLDREKCYIRLEPYNDPRSSSNQSTSLKSGLTLWSVCFVLYVRTLHTDGRTPSPEIMMFWFVLGRGLKNRSHWWSTWPAHTPNWQWFSLDFLRFLTNGQTNGRTTCVKVVITTDQDCGRPRGSIFSEHFYLLSKNLTHLKNISTALHGHWRTQ